MIVTSVDLYKYGSTDHISLSYRDPLRENPFNVRSIEGLDAGNGVTPKYYASGGSGVQYYEMLLQGRDIVPLIDLNPHSGGGATCSALRDQLYKFISSSRSGMVQFRFMNGTTCIAAIYGFVTKIEAPLFEQDPEVKLTVSCVDPMLRALTTTTVDVAHLDAIDPVISDPLSTAPHGLTAALTFTSSTPSMFIKDPAEDWAFTVAPTTLGGFQADDVLHISSEFNKKTLYVRRSGVDHHLIDSLFPGSVWPVIFPGDNHFKCSTRFEWTSASYLATYWGV